MNTFVFGNNKSLSLDLIILQTTFMKLFSTHTFAHTVARVRTHTHRHTHTIPHHKKHMKYKCHLQESRLALVHANVSIQILLLLE